MLRFDFTIFGLNLQCNTRMRRMLKRDIQGKFALKNDDYRQVRSLRLTDETWKALGIAAECLGMTRADYVEQVIRGNAHPGITRGKELVHEAKTSVVEVATTPYSVATLESLRNQVIVELKLGKLFPWLQSST